VSFGLGCRAKSHPNAEPHLCACSKSLLLTDRYRFRHWPIRFAPILAGLSPISPGAAVYADLGFAVIAIKSERVVIITIRRRIPHGPHFGSSKKGKGFAWTHAARAAESIGLRIAFGGRRCELLCISGRVTTKSERGIQPSPPVVIPTEWYPQTIWQLLCGERTLYEDEVAARL
jgi:hypothetical protein